ncbi:MAG: choice-of-anchor B family protein [Ignavibacteria bacterium]|nr:choice-of-anchor B family protein [Ignavibacteria bacterium]
MRSLISVFFFVLLSTAAVISQQNNIVVLAHYNYNTYHSSCWGYESAGREYAVFGWLRGTTIFDITDEDNIREVAFLPGKQSGWREMKIYNNYLYVVSEADSSGIQIVNLKNLPDRIDTVRTYFFEGYKRAHTISQNGRYLYINGGNYREGGIVVLDAGVNPEKPVKLGEWQTDYVHDCRVVNDTIWACNPLTGRVTAIDSKDKSNLKTITSWVNGANPVPHNCAVTADGKYLYVCDENFSYPGKLKIWNISDKNDIIFENEWSVNGSNESVHNIDIFGNYAFLSYYGEGAKVLDITDPVNPVEIASIKTTACWQMYYFSSGKIIASDIYDGIYVLRTLEPISVRGSSEKAGSYSLHQNFPNPFNPVTKIKFGISGTSAEQTLLTVFDIIGRRVAVLVNGKLQPGTYEADWDASAYPSGVYYYKLESGSFSETKKMVLIK